MLETKMWTHESFSGSRPLNPQKKTSRQQANRAGPAVVQRNATSTTRLSRQHTHYICPPRILTLPFKSAHIITPLSLMQAPNDDNNRNTGTATHARRRRFKHVGALGLAMRG
ncbi:unnamed protein product [Boreogadus saida]